MKWEKVGKHIGADGTTITYRLQGAPQYEIESRKRHIPHANGSGTWDHTTYVVLYHGLKVAEKMTLKAAKEYVGTMLEAVTG